jgi:hypothetical protein
MRTHAVALAVGLAAFVLYNANGREIGGYDTQPAKFAAIELAARGTLTLDRVVAAEPGYASRSAFARDRQGRYRSAYPLVDPAIAGAVAWTLAAVRVLDLDAPLAPALAATFTASLVTAVAVALAFLTARHWLSAGHAVLVALGFGLGTNVWLIAQTLSQHDVVVFGLMGAVYCLVRPPERWSPTRMLVLGALLAITGAARPQVAPAIAVLLAGTSLRAGWRLGALAAAPVALAGLAVIGTNLYWFGHPLGGMAATEALHPYVHGVTGTFSSTPWVGAAGLLASPSRGILVFSPVVLVVLAAAPRLWNEGLRGPLALCLAAGAVQFSLYASYTVWWGGHTYGPRYMIDILPLTVPLAAAGVQNLRGQLAGILTVLALAWSVGVAATGAFVFPAERWNTDPVNIDTNHDRLWNWRDLQFVRCWQAGLNDRNFMLFTSEAFRRAPEQ